MAKKIIFRGDGNSDTGLGHLFRLFALIEIFKEEYEYVLVTNSSTLLTVIPEKYNIAIIPEEVCIQDEAYWFSKHYPAIEYVLVLDGYQFNSYYQKKIKNNGYRLVYIDDLTHEHMYADLVINHSPHATIEQYNSENYTKFALGTNYAILRPSFLKKPQAKREITIPNIAFVSFGGADKHNFTYKFVLELLNIAQIKRINVVIGGAYNFSNIFELGNKNDKVKIFKNLDEESLYTLMNTCNFAIAPTSTILFELISVNMYLVSGYYVENQKMGYYELVKRNVFEGIGDINKYKFNFLKNHLLNVVQTDISTQIKSQQHLIDGNQKSRFLKLMKNLSKDGS
tara:strand:+ start:5051 stop:6070 length:1020 start_codon:yes stop_codon:yes gene_type:complete